MNKEMPTTASNVITLQESQELARAALRAYDPDFKPVSNRESLPKLRKIPVTIRAAIARGNRKLFDKGWGPQICTSRSSGEKEIGRWLLVKSNFVKDGFNDLARLEEYLREIGVLREIEVLEDAGRA